MSDDKTKLQELNKLIFKDQAIWMLNAIWPEMKDSKAEDIWNLRNIFAEFEIENHDEGNSLDELGLHRVLERLGNQQTVQEMRNHLRTVGVENFKKVSFILFLIWYYKQDWHKVVNAPQGGNQEEIEKAQKMFDEVSKLLEECQKKAEEAKQAASAAKKAADAATERANDAKKSADAAAERQAEAQAAEDEVAAALKDVTDKEDAKKAKMEELRKKSQEGGVVSRNKALNELAQLEKEDDLPLRKAKTTLEAAKRKAEKATNAAKEAREKADADKAAADAAKEEADVAQANAEKASQEADEAVTAAQEKMAEAEAFLEEAKKNNSGDGQGTMWWMDRELHEKKKFLPSRKGGIAKN